MLALLILLSSSFFFIHIIRIHFQSEGLQKYYRFSCPSLWMKYFLFVFDSFLVVFFLAFPYLQIGERDFFFSVFSWINFISFFLGTVSSEQQTRDVLISFISSEQPKKVLFLNLQTILKRSLDGWYKCWYKSQWYKYIHESLLVFVV